MVVSANQPILSAQGLGFAYDDAQVLAGVDLAVMPGEMVGVIGPNGTGKSTLLGLMCGLIAPRAGEVRLLGKPLAAYPRKELARLMGMVPQSPELAPGFTVMETVLSGRFAVMGGRVFEGAEDMAAAERALEMTGLTPLAQREAGALSGGECQRLALARAMAPGPQVLLLDEPTSALDLDHQVRLMTRLERACRDDGLAVCLVSHDLNLASLFCSRLALIARGGVLAMGAPGEVITAELIASAYGVQVAVDAEPGRGRPRVTLIAPEG